MKILMAGGGTAGSVSPLIAIYEKIKVIEPDSEFVFIGTKEGDPENEMLRGYSIKLFSIFSGKFRRYLDIKNITDVFKTIIGFFQAIIIISKTKPDVVIGTGGYVSVPVIWAAWFNRVKILIHQQDIIPSLSNLLCVNLADLITVSFEKSLRDFPSKKTLWIGNPVKKSILEGDRNRANDSFNLDHKLPLILITGGGTGAMGINTIINQALPELIKFAQVIILTGKGKKITGIANDNFQQFEFINDGMNDLLTRADLVISRAGLSTITELSALGKMSILIPMPNTHQEQNAVYLDERQASVIIGQLNLSPTILVDKVQKLLENPTEMKIYQENMNKIMKKDSADLISEQILKLIKNESK